MEKQHIWPPHAPHANKTPTAHMLITCRRLSQALMAFKHGHLAATTQHGLKLIQLGSGHEYAAATGVSPVHIEQQRRCANCSFRAVHITRWWHQQHIGAVMLAVPCAWHSSTKNHDRCVPLNHVTVSHLPLDAATVP
jgi:hypothetical protein